MCNPAALAVTSAVMSIGSAVTGYQGARAQQKLQQYQYEQNQVNTNAALRDNYQSTQQRMAQESAAAAQQVEERKLQALKEQSTARVAAGEAGVTGLSVEAVLGDIAASAGRDVSNIQQNRDWSLEQLGSQLRSQRTQAAYRLGSVMPGQKVSPVPFLLQAGGGVASAGSSYHAMTK